MDALAQLTRTERNINRWLPPMAMAKPVAKPEVPERDQGDRPAALARCRQDVVHFINTYVWTYDPRRADKGQDAAVPFQLYPYQVEYLHWLEERLVNQENGLVEKSRDMGATWLNAAFDLHHWLFRPGYKAGIGSRKLELVDRLGDMDAIFPKIRFMLYRLPSWMLPIGFDPRQHDNYCRLYNPETGGALTGEGGDEIGRGGRNTRYTIDEHASLPRAELVEQAVSQNTNCVIYTSTPRGTGNMFARKRFSGRVPIFTMHWRDHPLKDEAWYEAQCTKYDPVTIAQEVDIDYSASVEGVCIPAKWVRAAVLLHERLSELQEIKTPNEAGLDVGETRDESVYTNRRGPVVHRQIAWQGLNTTQTARRAARLAEEDEITLMKYDAGGPGAGVSGTFETQDADSEEAVEVKGVPFRYVGVAWGVPARDEVYEDAPERLASERFLNLKMEQWWNLRLHFERTYEHVEGIRAHPLASLISIPNDETLIAQLSQPVVVETGTGKLRLETKKELKRRGVQSPDRAESLVYAFARSIQPSQGYRSFWD